jgi:hypothetical protein
LNRLFSSMPTKEPTLPIPKTRIVFIVIIFVC